MQGGVGLAPACSSLHPTLHLRLEEAEQNEAETSGRVARPQVCHRGGALGFGSWRPVLSLGRRGRPVGEARTNNEVNLVHRDAEFLGSQESRLPWFRALAWTPRRLVLDRKVTAWAIVVPRISALEPPNVRTHRWRALVPLVKNVVVFLCRFLIHVHSVLNVCQLTLGLLDHSRFTPVKGGTPVRRKQGGTRPVRLDIRRC